MTKYLLRFYKHGNMRFISHLDLNRLFRRAIKKMSLDIAYSNGYNPHEKMNIVQPLSLGYESDSEYLEITTLSEHDPSGIVDGLNSSMPEDIRFFDCKAVSEALGNLSNRTSAASYSASVPMSEEDFDRIDISSFLNREQILIKKRDKKTKQMVDKDYKNYIYSISKDYKDDHIVLNLLVRCATNETLNPSNLITALLDFSGISVSSDLFRIKRSDMLSGDSADVMISLFELNG